MGSNSLSKTNWALDYVKLIASVLILGLHALPIFRNVDANAFFGQWLFRLGVPLFLVSSGFYFNRMSQQTKLKYIKNIFIIYLIGTALYAPIFAKSITGIFDAIKIILFGYFHLWYLSSLLIALVIIYLLDRFHCKLLYSKVLMILLILMGALFDEYYRFIDIALVRKIKIGLLMFGGGRSTILFALPLLMIGGWISAREKIVFNLRKWIYLMLLFISLSLSIVEFLLLKNWLGDGVSLDVTLFNYLPAVFIVILTFYLSRSKKCSIDSRYLRKSTDIFYIIHIWIITLVGRILGLSYELRFAVSAVISLVFSLSIVWVFNWVKQKRIASDALNNAPL